MKYNYSTNRLENIDHTIKGDFPVDFNLLFDIMYQQSPTYEPALEVRKKEWLIKLLSKIDGVIVEEKAGNIYCTKGEAEYYPTVVAHYDTAQDYHNGMHIFKTDKWIFGFADSTGEQCGLGLDDAVGVCFAIQMLKIMPVCKVFLPYGEERGLVGTYACDMSFFDNSLVVTQLDRRSYSNDFIKLTNGVQTFNPEHYSLIEPLMAKYGYTFNSGTATDVGGLRKRGLKVSSHNLSCGYFNEHANDEIASVSLVINAFSFAYDMLKMLTERNIPLNFPLPAQSIKSELPYGGSKSKTNQITMWEDTYVDSYYDFVTGEYVNTSSSKKENKTSSYWSKDMPSELVEEQEKNYEEYNEWILECYPEYLNSQLRTELKSYSVLFPDIDVSQTIIDEWIIDEICPHCYTEDSVINTNDLLLNSCCHSCESVFNVPKQDQDFVETKIKECIAGKMDFQEIADM